MGRILASGWFLASTAICCAIGVGFTSWIADDSSAAVRAVAALIGLGAALAVMLLVAWVLAADPDVEPATVAAVAAPAPVPPALESTDVVADDPLTLKLEDGLALQETVASGAADDRVHAWIEDVHQTLERDRPGVLGYFDALASRPFADDRDRLEAHVGRLATIVGDFV